MSIPSLLDALASRLLRNDDDSPSAVQAKRRFSESVLLGNTSQLDASIQYTSVIDPQVALNGVALSWEIAQRFDHSSAVRLLLDRLKLCPTIPNAIYSSLPSYYGYKDETKAQLAFTEQTATLQLLYSLYSLQTADSADPTQKFNPQEHKLTKYANEARRMLEQGSDREQKELGWFFAAPTVESRSHRDTSNSAQLSINDTSFDTIWSHLLSTEVPTEDGTKTVLRHPVFSSPALGSTESPLESKPQEVNIDLLKADPTQQHRLDALGSLFGALRFPHPSLVLRSTLPQMPQHNQERLPSMRMDIADDRIGPLELPTLKLPSKDSVAPWVSIQSWKSSTMLPEKPIDSLGDDNSLYRGDSVEIGEVVSKPSTVAEFLERTWHGAANPLAPWQRLEIEGAVPVEEDPLEWRDRLVYRARLLNAVSQAVSITLEEYQEHIAALFPDSLQTTNALCNAFKRFLNFWRGELLFSKREPIPRNVTPPQPSALLNLVPALPEHITSELERSLEVSHQEASADPELNDFFESFHRIVSTSGSCTQILHLHQLLKSVLDSPTQAFRFPIGAEAINKLTEICIATEQDPILTRGISRQVLSLSLVPVAKFISEWLFWGALPPHRDFFIERIDESSPSTVDSHTELNASISSSSTLNASNNSLAASPSVTWLSGFSIKSSHVPSFLRPHIDLLLKTGVLVQISNELERIKPVQKDALTNRMPREKNVSAPLLRPVWRLPDLYSYYDQIYEYIGSSEVVSDEEWALAEALKSSGCDGLVSVEKSLSDSFVAPIQIQFDTISPRVCRRIIDEWGLLDTIERLKRDYFGTLITAAFEALPLGVDLLDGSSSSHTLDRLRFIFAENIQASLERLGYRLALEKIPKCSGIDVLENIFIEPTFLQWPLTVLITPAHIAQYNSIFVLLAKMTRTRAALNSVWTNLSHATRLAHREASSYEQARKKRHEEGSDQSIFEIDYPSIFSVQHKASIFCHQLEHFWSQLYAFIVQQVQHSCFHKVKTDIEKAYHFEELVNTHQEYINAVTKCALLDTNSRALLLIIEKTLHLVHKFRQQIRYSLADPSKWEVRARKQPLSVVDASVSLEQSLFGASRPLLPISTPSSDEMNTSVFEQANYQPDELEGLVSTTRGEFEKCMKFLMAVLLKLLSRGYEPHMAALVTSINWNKFYFSGPELMGQGQS